MVHLPQPVSEVDLDATRAQRQRLREEIRLRTHLVRMLAATAPDDGVLRIEAVGAPADLSA